MEVLGQSHEPRSETHFKAYALIHYPALSPWLLLLQDVTFPPVGLKASQNWHHPLQHPPALHRYSRSTELLARPWVSPRVPWTSTPLQKLSTPPSSSHSASLPTLQAG